jgi:hypothetical protein
MGQTTAFLVADAGGGIIWAFVDMSFLTFSALVTVS